MKRHYILLLIFLAASINFGQPVNETLDRIITRALEVSPKLKMLEAKKAAAVNRIPQQANLPDPMLTLGLTNLPTNSFSFTQEPMTGKIIGLSQAFPFPGKLGTVENVLSKDVEIIQKEIDDANNEIIKKVKLAYFELLFVNKEISIAEENKKLLNEVAKVVGSKYSVSTASQQHVIKVELEITKLANKIILLQKRKSAILASIRALLFDDPGKYLGNNTLPDIDGVEYDTKMLEITAAENRPYLLGLKIAQAKSIEQQKLAEYDFFPNFNLALQYSQRDEIARTNTQLNDFFSIVAGISLPLNYGGKATAKVEEAKSMQQFYSSQYDAAMQVLKAELGRIVAELNSLQQSYQLITRGKRQQTEQNYLSALSGYQVGKIDFVNVTDAMRNLFDVETELFSIKANYAKAIAELEFLIGSELSD